MLKFNTSPTLPVGLLGRTVSGAEAVGDTVTATVTTPPTESRMATLVDPAATPVIVKLVPDPLAVATLALPLLTVYGAVPPPIAYVEVAAMEMVTGLGALVKSAVEVPEPTVTLIVTDAPVASTTLICAEPSFEPPTILRLAATALAVATLESLV